MLYMHTIRLFLFLFQKYYLGLLYLVFCPVMALSIFLYLLSLLQTKHPDAADVGHCDAVVMFNKSSQAAMMHRFTPRGVFIQSTN